MEDTLIARLCKLALGGSESIAERISGDRAITFSVVAASMNSMAATLRNAAAKASNRSGYEFEVTRGEFRAKNGDTIITAVVTRINDGVAAATGTATNETANTGRSSLLSPHWWSSQSH